MARSVLGTQRSRLGWVLVALAVFYGAVWAQYPEHGWALLLGLVILYVSFVRPMYGVLGLMLTQLFVVGSSEGVSEGELFFQFLYVAVFMGWVTRLVIEREERLIPAGLNKPLRRFVFWLLLTLLPALYVGTTVLWWLRDLSALLNYLVFFIVVNTARKRRDLQRLIALFIGFCYLVTLRDLLVYLEMQGSLYLAIKFVARGQGGAVFWQSAFFFCLGQLLFERRPGRVLFYIASLFLFSATMLLSGTRTYVLSTGITVILFFFLVPRMLGRGGRRAVVPIVVGLLVMAFIGSVVINLNPTLHARYQSLGGALEGRQDDVSLQARKLETVMVFSEILKKPVLGYGLGRRITKFAAPIGGRIIVEGQTTFMHNSYLFFWHKTGLIGLIIFLLFLKDMVRQSWRLACETVTSAYKGLAIGFFFSLLGIAIMSFTTSKFADATTTLFLGTFSGVLFVYQHYERLARREQEEAGEAVPA